ncbi:MAG TPA: alpha/beta hydrolase [Eudoraea sp.]|nr:alpha/beta hydrolase [Eudoraea sp.]
MNAEKQIKCGRLTFDCLVAGRESDELVIFLHGFPETSYMWQDLITEVSKLGFFCVAPNLRGYSKGAIPKGKKYYTLDLLANDVIEIARFFGQDKFHLTGHDWGAAIGWKVVHDNPNALLSWAGLSVPHLQAFGEAIFTDRQQGRMSRYIKSFQMSYLPEWNLRKNDFALFKKLWKHSCEDEIENYLAAFRHPGTLTAALNYYRANYNYLKMAAKKQILGDIHTPSLFIWGNKDMAVGSVAVENGHEFMKNDYVFLELDTGHWLVQTKYADIKSALCEHLLKYKRVPYKG